MKNESNTLSPPLILAPAGSRDAFLAALAAGTDAVYCGLKSFSARMEADNFTIEELMPLATLARKKKVKVYVAFNSLIKPDELEKAGRLVKQLDRYVGPDALIIQDLSMVALARQAGYSGELHLSTLANLSFPKALKLVRKNFGVNRVVIPRELGIDEIKLMASACPEDVGLEVFVHGALCYGVSGRCYWSSFLGGKSGLRGQCVQPCRRRYNQKGQVKRFFSCQDLSLDVLAKLLLTVPQVVTWKIEGRKKGPHYVYNTVQAYRLFRDHANEPKSKKQALAYLEGALGRKSTHYYFLSQRPQCPVKTEIQTGSGFLVGKVHGPGKQPYLVPRESLFAGDLLRVGYEDEPGHSLLRVTKATPKKGRLYLNPSQVKRESSKAPVFLIDRKEKTLEMMLAEMAKEIETIRSPKVTVAGFSVKHTKRSRKKITPVEINVQRNPGKRNKLGATGIWLPLKDFTAIPKKGITSKCWWWLPPVIWPEQEKTITQFVERIQNKGGRNFVLNAPWQVALFPKSNALTLWAGPFCNQANSLSLEMLASAGFDGVILSPELGGDDVLDLCKKSPLPVGIVMSGNWPFCISRILADEMNTDELFKSPMGEQAWVAKHGDDAWVYPNWQLDLTAKKRTLQNAGCQVFVHFLEPVPHHVRMKKRPGLWNWNLKLL